MQDRFNAAIERIDAANAQDPNHTTIGDEEVSDELLYSQRMSEWLERLHPDASEELKLAVRCQHLCRWMIPRGSYPMDRTGYLRWRSDLAKFHATKAGEIMREVGYDEPMIARVQSLIRKERFKTDAEAQCLEDVACLVFLQHYIAEFSAQHEDEKVINILQRTWKKMSEHGHEAALTIEFGMREMSLMERALSPQVPPEHPDAPGAA